MQRRQTTSGCLLAVVGVALGATFSLSGARQTVTAQTPPATVFQGARVIVGDGSAPIENGVIVVQGNRITAVGRDGQVQIPGGAPASALPARP